MELLTSVVYQSVTTNRPRAWASHTNISRDDKPQLPSTPKKSMNSVEELSTYDLHYFGGKTAATTYDFPEHAPSSGKKDRKWSFGNLFFRRSKKKDDSDTSSAEEELRKNFLNRKKPKEKRKKEKRSLGNAFDHIVPASNASTATRQSTKNGFRMGGLFEDGVLSDPSGCFDSYLGRPLPRPPHNRDISSSLGSNSVANLGTPLTVHTNVHPISTSLGSSVDSLTKKNRKERTKARAVARRDSFNRHSSSDEEDSRSCSSTKFRSDESLTKRDQSASRRSRLARTERYIRRLSKDDESILNREAMQRQARENWQIRVRDDYSPHLPVTTTPPQMRKFYTPPNQAGPNNYNHSANYTYSPSAYEEELHVLNIQNRNSGLFTIPPSHQSHTNKFRNSNSHLSQHLLNEPSSIPDVNCTSGRIPMVNSSGNISQQYEAPNSKCFNIRSLSCDSNIHKSPSPEADPTPTRGNQNHRHRNLSLAEQPRVKQPPPPPPRDPRRMMQNAQPNNSCFDVMRPTSQWYPNLLHRRSQFCGYRTNSEDVIPTFERCENERTVNLVERPASAMTHEMDKGHPGVFQDLDKFKYLTEKRPRSRKPIFIQSTDRINSNKYNGSPSFLTQNGWKASTHLGIPTTCNISNDRQSPQIFTAQTHVQTKIFLPSTLNDNENLKGSMDTVDFCKTHVRGQSSPFKPISPTEMESTPNSKSEQGYTYHSHVVKQTFNLPKFGQTKNSNQCDFKRSTSSDSASIRDEPNEEMKRKSSNLEEALDELEAIYKSLHLGDEDLLERAEQREMDIHTQKILAKKNETLSGHSPMLSSGHFSDSSFSYEPYNVIESQHKKKSRTLERDRRNDDMALRKMKDAKDSTKTSFKSLTNVSYLLASPVHFESPPLEVEIECEDKSDKSEPDITFDDVVYRIVKHANNTLKVADPQLPFGIPIGPVALTSNSDYLHAVPEKVAYIPYNNKSKIPDIVKDDLAYRNLRKDANKEPALKPVSPVNFDINALSKESKKKRAVRSLSANISNLISQTERRRRDNDCENEFKKASLTDIADAMDIARQILKDKENRIQATKRAFLSDSETKYRAERPPGISASSTETITESRLNFLNEMRSLHDKSRGHSEEDEDKSLEQPKAKFPGDDFVLSKPPRGATPDRRFNKESTPVPVSTVSTSPDNTSRKDSQNSSFEELLTALAVEARETSDRITNELNTLDDSLKKSEFKEPVLSESTKKECDEIDVVSEHAKLCEKLLECVVESTELIASTKVEVPPEEEEVVQIDEHFPCVPQSKANIVTTRIDVVDVDVNPVDVMEVHSSSEHDYDNLISDYEDASKMSKSPFEEHRAELIASFQEMKSDLSDSDDHGVLQVKEAVVPQKPIKPKEDRRRYRKRSRRVPTPVTDPCEPSGQSFQAGGEEMDKSSTTPISLGASSRLQGSSEDRIARYKEERRRQLREQFKDGGSSSSGTETGATPRTTRAYRLRVAAAAATAASENASQYTPSPAKEWQNSSPSTDSTRSTKCEKDKSAKRKSNLNRTRTCEPLPPPVHDNDTLNGHTRRRNAHLVNNSSTSTSSLVTSCTTSTEDHLNDASLNLTAITSASTLSSMSFSPISSTANSTRDPSKPRKSELSIHMENARRGVTTPLKTHPIRPVTSSPVEKVDKGRANKENITQATHARSRSTLKTEDNSSTITRPRDKKVPLSSDKVASKESSSSVCTGKTNSRLSRRLEELTALTRETLARVTNQSNQQTANKTRPTIMTPSAVELEYTKKGQASTSLQVSEDCRVNRSKTVESHQPVPVSILKRKVFQEEKHEAKWLAATPPVTFSPNVVEPTSTNRKAGILKKRRSLDESQVLRHRSCSPDTNKSDSPGSILKSQRRSSLEDISIRTDPAIPSILKRKTVKDDDLDNSLNSPQGILKRRSGASSAGSGNQDHHKHHVSITTAVILAAAEGAEMILEPEPEVRPILKKKSFSEEGDDLKPILKKKSSTETDEPEEKPKRPILKIRKQGSKGSKDDYCSANESGSECDVRPILKYFGITSNEVSMNAPAAPRPRLSFCENRIETEDEVNMRRVRRMQQDQIFNSTVKGPQIEKTIDKDKDLPKPRNSSVFDLVMSFESSTGAIPKKKSSLKRHSDRYRTQPVTFNEFEASLNYVGLASGNTSANAYSLLDLSSTFLEHDMASSSKNDSDKVRHNDDPTNGKMSSDSAFQSLGDGLELDESSDAASGTHKSLKKVEPSNLALQMKAIALEAKHLKLANLKSGSNKVRLKAPTSRFSTQPVTSAEVDQATKLGKSDTDCANLSLSDRVNWFNRKMHQLLFPARKSVPTHDVVMASKIHSIVDSFNALDVSAISPVVPRRSMVETTHSPPLSPISLKTSSRTETLDEGISSNESDSDNTHNGHNIEDCSNQEDLSSNSKLLSCDLKFKLSPTPCAKHESASDTTSDESSGGREIQSIIGTEAMIKQKMLRKTQRQNDHNVQKSRSITALGNEIAGEFKVPKTPEQQKLYHVQKSSTTAAMQSATISELRAKLQHSGDNEWRKRTPKLNSTNEELSMLRVKNLFNDELSEKSSILKIRKDELDASSKQWKCRVEKSDAESFSVVGRMQKDDVPLSILKPDKVRRTPSYKRFKSKEANGNESPSTPMSSELKSIASSVIQGSASSPSSDSSTSELMLHANGRKVSILSPDDETYKSFFKSVQVRMVEHVDVNLEDFDMVPSHTLLVQKKNITVQRRRGASRNPLKVLAARNDIQHEYTEVITGFAEREAKRLKIEKLAKNSHLSMEALAGLASKEDITAVSLKKASSSALGSNLPFKAKMLLQIKGRRHVQTRLVEPVASSINEGDNYILITPSKLYNYVGCYSNVIEQSRAADIINHIQQNNDMGCKPSTTVILDSKMSTQKDFDEFWHLLDVDNKSTVEVTKAGHPDEDECYESQIIDTNMVYTLENDELVSVTKYWSTMPKIEMLEPSKVFVFDFGTEMYVWSGKTASTEVKKKTLHLAKEMWDMGYNYTECGFCPINVASILGARSLPKEQILTEASRPDWALFAKLTQHRETILFREKFLDWPDYTRVIKVRESDTDKIVPDPIMESIKPLTKEQLDLPYVEPDFEVEGSHLGRGRKYFDEETRRHFEINTLGITTWKILENTYEKLDSTLLGHFYNTDTYIVRWEFRVSVTGRELSGKPSKHLQLGRDRCVYFSWLGEHASINDKGTTALLTVELDSENAKQIRLTQGSEPPVFLQLFDGKMVVHNGKLDNEKEKLYILRGEVPCETSLLQVPVSMRSLRSRSSFLYMENKQMIIWHGAKSTQHIKLLVKKLAENIAQDRYEAFDISKDVEINIFVEGKEDLEFLNRLGEKPQLYYSLKDSKKAFEKTPVLFKFSSISGKFEVSQIQSPHRSSDYITPYPFLQSDLYTANQPALFLLDNEHELWLWQGWWPETENTESEQTGSGPVRWQAERRAAMQTVLDYYHYKNPVSDSSIPAYLVWAGLEPLEFTNLFPTWTDRDDIAELNIKTGVYKTELTPVEKELAALTRSTYPLAELLQRPLPVGVDPTHLEIYLTPEDFHEILCMCKEDFQHLPLWKQTSLKKEKGLF